MLIAHILPRGRSVAVGERGVGLSGTREHWSPPLLVLRRIWPMIFPLNVNLDPLSGESRKNFKKEGNSLLTPGVRDDGRAHSRPRVAVA